MSDLLAADLTQSVFYEYVDLNPGVTYTNGVPAGCITEEFDASKVQVRQNTEPVAKDEGIEVGGVWLDSRTIVIKGTVYGLTRGDAMDRLATLEAALDPVAGYQREPATFGFLQMAWTLLDGTTANLHARPNGLQVVTQRTWFGGPDSSPLAIPWAVTLISANPQPDIYWGC